MRMGLIRRRLARQQLLTVLIGVGISLIFVTGTVCILWDMHRSAAKPNDLLSIQFLGATCSVIGLMLAGWGVVRVVWVYDCRHADLRPLGRYGPPAEVVEAIEGEVRSGRRLLRLGKLPSFLNRFRGSRELCGHQVILTESWLLDFWRQPLGWSESDGFVDDRVNVMRLADLAQVPQEEPSVYADGQATLYLLDRHGVGLRIYGTDAAVERLRAEVLARVPWVLERFGPQGGATAEDGRRDQPRRADIQRKPPQAPASPPDHDS